MKIKIVIGTILLAGLALMFWAFRAKGSLDTMSSSGLFFHKSIDDKIKEAELIVIGEVITTLPSQWNGPGGRTDPTNASSEEIFDARGLFTDSLVSINQILRGDFSGHVVRVRSFVGKTDKIKWESEGQPLFEVEQMYLLFLEKDTGATARVNPGDYISVNGNMAIYEIVDGRAISADDEWALEDLVAYIEQSLSTETPLPPTDLSAEAFTVTPEATELPIETASPTP